MAFNRGSGQEEGPISADYDSPETILFALHSAN
jgi:hypothetical protein